MTAFLTAVFEATDPNEMGTPDLTVVELLDMSAERAITDARGNADGEREDRHQLVQHVARLGP